MDSGFLVVPKVSVGSSGICLVVGVVFACGAGVFRVVGAGWACIQYTLSGSSGLQARSRNGGMVFSAQL